MNATSQRAGWFLEQAHPGPHKDKRIAAAFEISPAMAKLLRAGRSWTMDRLEQAKNMFGRDFVDFVFHVPEAEEIHARIAEVERAIAEIRGGQA